jgi:hypothetical protein
MDWTGNQDDVLEKPLAEWLLFLVINVYSGYLIRGHIHKALAT